MSYELGMSDLKDKLVPQNGAFDTAYLQEIRLIDGATGLDVINLLTNAINQFNTSILTVDPMGLNWIPSLISLTDDPTVEYTGGGQPKFQKRTEYSRPDTFHVKEDGHTLKLDFADLGLGFTKQKLKNVKFSKIAQAINTMLLGARSYMETDILRTLTSNQDVSVSNNAVSVPFVGGGVIPFVPPTYSGKVFNSSHTHYFRYLEASLAESLDQVAFTLHEHGIYGVWDAFVSESDLNFYAALNDDTYGVYWRNKQYEGVSYSNQLTLAESTMTATPTNPGIIETRYGVFRLRTTSRITSNPGTLRHFAAYKSFGSNVPNNPLRWRFDPREGGPLWAGEATNDMGDTTWEVFCYVNGVSSVGPNRLQAALVTYAPAGNYVSPTIIDE